MQILEKHGMGAKVGPAGALTADRISRLSAEGARLVCLSYFDADLSTAGARFAVRRLRRRLGEIKILASFWQSGPGQASELCAATKADFYATRFKEGSLFVSTRRSLYLILVHLEAACSKASGELLSGRAAIDMSSAT
ncbi:MAG: hypothetical protein WCC90_01990 [Methylocella sp.]